MTLSFPPFQLAGTERHQNGSRSFIPSLFLNDEDCHGHVGIGYFGENMNCSVEST